MFFFCLLGISIWCGLILVLFMGFESGIRQKMPYDFIFQIKWLVDFFEQKGFIKSGYEGLGSDNPT